MTSVLLGSNYSLPDPRGIRPAEGAGAPPYDAAAFEALHAQTSRSARAFALRICRDREDADDVSQLAYLVLYQYWVSGRLRESPRRLLFRVVHRAAVDVIRARARRQRLARSLEREVVDGVWLHVELRDALGRLSASDKQILVTQAEGALTYRELSGVMRQSLPAVRSRLSRARRALARQFGPV